MLAENSDQAIAILHLDLTPSYLNPAMRRMLGLVDDEGLAPDFAPYRVQLRCVDHGCQTIIPALYRRGKWRGEIHVLHDGRAQWSLTLSGRVELLRHGTRKLGFAIVGREHAAAAGAVGAKLTIRENEVLRALLAGDTSKAIAEKLKISHRTVEAHRANIMRKFAVKTLPGLFRIAMQLQA